MRQKAMWQKFKTFGSFCLIMLLLPYVVTVFVHGKDFAAAGDKEKLFVNVKKTKETEIVQVPWTEYFVGIMGREVPVDAEIEFLKAQAVLIRTKLYQELDSQTEIKAESQDNPNVQDNQGTDENTGAQKDQGGQENPENQGNQQNNPENQDAQQNAPENPDSQSDIAENENAQQNAAAENENAQQNAVAENENAQQNAVTENENVQQNAAAENENVQQNAAAENEKAQQNIVAENENAQQNAAAENENAQQNAVTENENAQQNNGENNQQNSIRQEGESDIPEPKILDEQYLVREELEKKAGTSEIESYYSRLLQAMQETENQVLLYQDTYAVVPFHQSSNGMTRSAQEVLGTETCPYLAVRECPLDKEADDEMQVTTFEYKDVQAKCQSFLVAVAEEDANKTYEFSDFEIISHDSAGYVTQMRIGETICTGDQFRDALSLASSAFSIKDGEGKLRITTMGKGHGLGMSQWTAQQMAKSGNSYEEILQFFFEGTTLTDGGDAAEKLE